MKDVKKLQSLYDIFTLIFAISVSIVVLSLIFIVVALITDSEYLYIPLLSLAMFGSLAIFFFGKSEDIEKKLPHD